MNKKIKRLADGMVEVSKSFIVKDYTYQKSMDPFAGFGENDLLLSTSTFRVNDPTVIAVINLITEFQEDKSPDPLC